MDRDRMHARTHAHIHTHTHTCHINSLLPDTEELCAGSALIACALERPHNLPKACRQINRLVKLKCQIPVQNIFSNTKHPRIVVIYLFIYLFFITLGAAVRSCFRIRDLKGKNHDILKPRSYATWRNLELNTLGCFINWHQTTILESE